MILCDTWKVYEIQIAVSLEKFYGNALMLTHLHIIYGCFGAIMTDEGMQQKPDGLQSVTRLLSGVLQKKCAKVLL